MKIEGKLIIGIGYQMGAGKDSIATRLYNTHGFVVIRFADALKEAASIIFGWDRESLENLEFKMTVDKFWGETPRTLLQRMGTEAMRDNVDKQIWVKALERRILDCGFTKVVIPDMRFKNEVKAIKGWGGYTVKVTRPHFVVPGLKRHSKHKSEKELDAYRGWNYKIVNDTDLLNLWTKTDVMLYEIEKKHDR